MPSCSLSETIHNKWQLQSGNHKNDLFAAPCDEKIQVVMQMTNYKAYLKGNFSRTGPSRQELKLKAARLSIDPKKIVDALSQILWVEGVKTCISHLKGKEIFGSTKRKLDLSRGSNGDFHRPDKVKFSQPLVISYITNCKHDYYNVFPC
jgi:hypothetical protein